MGASKILKISLTLICLSSTVSYANKYFSHLTVEDAQRTRGVERAWQLKGIGPHLIEIHNDPLFGRNVILRAHYFKAENPKALVLGVHGLQSNARWFMQSGTELAKKGISVLVYDRRGSGLSDGNKRLFSLPDFFDPNPEATKNAADGARGHIRTGLILRRFVPNASREFMSDIDAAYEKLVELNDGYKKADGKSDLDVHILANCFGSRIAIPYAKKNSKIKSLIVTAPATDMDPRADVDNIFDKTDIAIPLIHFGGPLDYLKSPLKDEYFVSRNNPAYSGIANNEISLSLRYATGDFYWATRDLTKNMYKDIPKLEIPLLVFLGTNDKMVNNEAIKQRFRNGYKAEGKIITLEAEHMLEFTPAGKTYAEATARWILEDLKTDKNGRKISKPTNISLKGLSYVVGNENIGTARAQTAAPAAQPASPQKRRTPFSRP